MLIQADVKNNENLSENYADNVMELVNSKVPGLFKKRVSGLCVDSEIFCGNRKISGILNYTVENEKALKAGLENMISTLCMELHAFEYMRFHLAVSGEAQDIGQ